MAPSAVNNGGRGLEGLIARYFFDNDTSVLATLSGSLITITANRNSLTLTNTTSNYISNYMQAFTMGANPNLGPVRVTIDGVGPISVRDNFGSSLSSSFLLAGQRALIVKDGTNDYFRLLTPELAQTANARSRLALVIGTDVLAPSGDGSALTGVATILSGNGQVTAANISYLGTGGAARAELQATGRAPYAGTLKNLYVQSDVAPGSSQAYTCAIRNEQADTSVTVTISGAAAVQGANTSNTQAFAAGEKYSLKIVTSATAATAFISWDAEFEVL